MSSSRNMRVESAEESKAMRQQVLGGGLSPARDIVLLNAGAALYVADVAPSIQAGIELAREAINSGKAKAKLQEFVTHSLSLKN